MNSSITLSQKVEECQAQFHECLNIPELSEDDWLEQKFAEFNWWTSGLNANKTDLSSLDRRLSLRPDVKDVIADLLDGLITALSECKEIYVNGALSVDQLPPRDALSPGLAPLENLNRAHSPFSSSDTSQSASRPGSPASHDEADPTLDQYIEQRYYVETNIEILLRIHTAIKRSGLKFRNKRADDALKKAKQEYLLLRERVGEHKALNDTEVGEHERFRRFLAKIVLCRGYQQNLIHRMQRDIAHSITKQGPFGRDTLVQTKVMIVVRAFFEDKARLTPVQRRLIEANVTRRNRFIHARRTRETNSQIQEVQNRPTALEKVERKTTAATVVTQGSTSPDRLQATPHHQASVTAPNKGKQKADRDDLAEQSATALGSNFTISGATAMGSKNTKSAATKMSARIDHLDYPQCPARDGPFECPLCPEILPGVYTEKKRWRAHVAQDLNPYVCIFEDCPHPDELYTSTYEWMSHMATYHTVTRWLCQLCSKQPAEHDQQSSVFEKPSDWIDHMLEAHEMDPEHPDLALRLEASKRSAGIQKTRCPLCQNKLGLAILGEDDDSSDISFPVASTEEFGLVELEQDEHIANHIHEFALQSLPWNIAQFNKSDASFRLSNSTTKHEITFQPSPEGHDLVAKLSALEASLDDPPTEADSPIVTEADSPIATEADSPTATESFAIPSSTSHPNPNIPDAEYASNSHTISEPTHNRETAVVYVRSRALIRSSASQVGDSAGHHQARRAWDASIIINYDYEFPATITDPFLENEYKDVFEHYLRDVDGPGWNAEAVNMTLQEDGVGITQPEDQIRKYGELLLGSLKLGDYLSPTATGCHICIVDSPDPSGDTGPGLHCLAWELLEAIQHATMPKLRLRVTRLSNVPPMPQSLRPSRSRHLQHSLADVQADQALNFHVLLVVARDFSRSGAQRDQEPDLAQWPLMKVQRKLQSRLLLEVVRPGSFEALEEHLEVRASQGVHFHLVHFDLHGRIMHGNEVPWLIFARNDHVSRTHDYQVPQSSHVKADAVAAMLSRYEIENVVLNACLSAYNRSGSGTSLAHIFLEYGICNISAMWFYVHWQTIATYLDTFYEQLLVQCKDFHLAAYCGREAIRQKPTNRGGRACLDFFLCVNYTSKRPVGDISPTHEPIPALLARSQGSTMSTTSVKSLMSGVWKPSTPQLGAFSIGDEPVMRMQLHLLELEFKLMIFRIVYASDLGRSGSKLHRTVDQMVHIWLNTNLFGEVLHYKGKDFARSRLLPGSVRPRERLTKDPNGKYLQLLFPPKTIRALRQTLHIVHEVDHMIAPGNTSDPGHDAQLEQRQNQVQEGLQQFAERLHADKQSCLLFLGSEDAEWWRTHLQYLQGQYWCA